MCPVQFSQHSLGIVRRPGSCGTTTFVVWCSLFIQSLTFFAEGDHIKITASKYPFPTVCADKQSTDWFHAISRTLKWNERERQKSFVVVEEGPSRKSSMKQSRSPEEVNQATRFDVHLEDEDEEDETTSDDEDNKFDIDDSSPEATSRSSSIHIPNQLNAKDAAVGIAKAREETGSQTDEELLSTPELAALALTQGRRLKFSRSAKSRSRSRSGFRSGVDTPGRFAGPTHRPPYISHHQVDYQPRIPSPALSNSSDDSLSNMDVAQRGARDDIHSHEHYSSARSRIPKDREFDDDLQTPTMADTHSEPRNHNRVNLKDYDHHHPRAFAVWGNDESDSNASDSDA
jgi:NAD+ kinase